MRRVKETNTFQYIALKVYIACAESLFSLLLVLIKIPFKRSFNWAYLHITLFRKLLVVTKLLRGGSPQQGTTELLDEHLNSSNYVGPVELVVGGR